MWRHRTRSPKYRLSTNTAGSGPVGRPIKYRLPPSPSNREPSLLRATESTCFGCRPTDVRCAEGQISEREQTYHHRAAPSLSADTTRCDVLELADEAALSSVLAQLIISASSEY